MNKTLALIALLGLVSTPVFANEAPAAKADKALAEAATSSVTALTSCLTHHLLRLPHPSHSHLRLLSLHPPLCRHLLL
mgnify:CR=1 FL=1